MYMLVKKYAAYKMGEFRGDTDTMIMPWDGGVVEWFRPGGRVVLVTEGLKAGE